MLFLFRSCTIIICVLKSPNYNSNEVLKDTCNIVYNCHTNRIMNIFENKDV